MNNWHIGQKVVCIKSYTKVWASWIHHFGYIVPIEGNIYTIKEIFTDSAQLRCYNQVGNVCFRFNEICNVFWDEELGYDQMNFRPLVEKETDISIFTDMLETKETEIV